MPAKNNKEKKHPDEDGISLPGENRDPQMRKDVPPETGKEEIRAVKENASKKDLSNKTDKDNSGKKEIV